MKSSEALAQGQGPLSASEASVSDERVNPPGRVSGRAGD
jgi:hypothetical protein